MARGKLILVIGPTGSGKGSLIRHAQARFPELGMLYSYTTRARRPDAVENAHYHFIAKEEFEKMIAEGKFLEWAQFSDNYYGTLKSDVEQLLAEGKVIIKEIEVQGVRQLRKLLPAEDLVTVFVNGGSWEDMAARAMKRDPLSEEELAKRKARYDDEVTFMPEADIIVNNLEGKFDEADQAFDAVIQKALVDAK